MLNSTQQQKNKIFSYLIFHIKIKSVWDFFDVINGFTRQKQKTIFLKNTYSVKYTHFRILSKILSKNIRIAFYLPRLIQIYMYAVSFRSKKIVKYRPSGSFNNNNFSFYSKIPLHFFCVLSFHLFGYK